MMNIRLLLHNVEILEEHGSLEVPIRFVSFDSRKIEEGSVYVAIPGTQVDGHRFIRSAIDKGAVAVVCEQIPPNPTPGVTFVRVRDSSLALGQIAAILYGRPTEKLKLVGVTGTNGKTTTATLLFDLFRSLGYRAGLFSTIKNQINSRVIQSTHSTPDAVQLSSLMRNMVDEGCTHCFMEVTSHGVQQNRVAGLRFCGGIFTNLTPEHLDYHHTLEAYLKAKKRFFNHLGENAFALYNVDDPYGLEMVRDTKARKYSYALENSADFNADLMDNTISGLTLEIEGHAIHTKLIGSFNAYNLLATYAAAILLEEEKSKIGPTLSILNPIEGRFDWFISPNNVTGIVDFAHTPDALKKILAAVHSTKATNARVITVVGCGGDRDTEKRPVMARIAYEESDYLILTSDNPRTEDPDAIIQDMRQGLPKDYIERTDVIPDRLKAIHRACSLAQTGDVILVAGKGHEKYQDIMGEKLPFDDKALLREHLP